MCCVVYYLVAKAKKFKVGFHRVIHYICIKGATMFRQYMRLIALFAAVFCLVACHSTPPPANASMKMAVSSGKPGGRTKKLQKSVIVLSTKANAKSICQEHCKKKHSSKKLSNAHKTHEEKLKSNELK